MVRIFGYASEFTGVWSGESIIFNGREWVGTTELSSRHAILGIADGDHLDDREGCCPLHGMASDVSRSGEAVKAAYREVAEMVVRVFEAHLNEPQARERALALLALCVGGMVLARGVDDPGLADDFRSAAYEQALRTAGWGGAQGG